MRDCRESWDEKRATVLAMATAFRAKMTPRPKLITLKTNTRYKAPNVAYALVYGKDKDVGPTSIYRHPTKPKKYLVQVGK